MCDEDERKNDKSWREKFTGHAILHLLPDESWAAAVVQLFLFIFSRLVSPLFSLTKLDVPGERRLRFHALRAL